MKIDWRTYITPIELMIMDDYLDFLDNHLPQLMDAERTRIWRGVDTNDEEARQGAAAQQHYLDEGISTRFLTAAALVGTWAMYESSVTRLANYVRSARGLAIRPNHLRGEFLERTRRYFDDVLRLPMHPPDTPWEMLDLIAVVRHALAHANGRIEDISTENRNKIEQALPGNPGLIVRDDYLIVSRPFARESQKLVSVLVKELDERVWNEVQNTH